MATADAKKVLQLKHQLKESCEGHTLLKVLKKLEELDITLDVLAETGIGKVVNSFRKHDEAGKLAKMLVNRWKKLVPKDSLSSRLEQPNGEVEETRKEENNRLSESSNSKKKSKNDHFGTERKMSHNIDIKSEIKPSKSKMYLNGERTKDNDLNLDSQTDKKYHGKDKTSSAENIKLKHESKKNEKISGIMSKQQSSSPTKVQATSLKATETHLEKMKKAKEKLIDMDAGEQNGNVSEMASMSFEAYLSYDLDPPKRKKSFSTAKNLKRLKIDHKENSQALESVKTSKTVTHTSLLTKLQAPEGSVMDLLSVPLPTSFPECEDVSQYQYFSEKKADRKVVEVFEEAPVFIGQRLKNKMQVYSGSKITYLPTMMTLYQQCIRALQNNIDALYEIGGVPFEILEPVVERCTPEQLLRIEECNPVYIGVTDHLWERHCLKDFRNAQLDEYESWRELYIRMSEERETKLKLLTKSIVSAHSGKPKGRQVKMAFIHSAAKPPRNVRIQQEIHGTAGPVTLPHPADKPSCVKLHECRGRSNFSEPSKPSPMSSGQAQDPRKMKRVAPMMAKSLKAFKKQLSRR